MDLQKLQQRFPLLTPFQVKQTETMYLILTTIFMKFQHIP